MNSKLDNKIYSKHFNDFSKKMKKLGFTKYRSTVFIRRNECDILEEIHIQKYSSGERVTANYNFSLLYQPYFATHFQTSGRFSNLVYGHDYWWPLDTEKNCEIAFNDFYKIINEKILPEFSTFKDKNKLIELCEEKLIFYRFYLKVFIELYYKEYKKAKQTHNYIVNEFDNLLVDVENDADYKCDCYADLSKIPIDIFDCPQKCKKYLEKNILENIERMKYPLK